MKYFILFLFVLLATSCNRNNDDVQLSSEIIPNYEDKTFLAKEFAKILAFATEDTDMRDFIKQVSLKKFDGDNNFLFVQAEDESLNPQTKSGASTFKDRLREKSQVITKSSGSEIDFDKLITSIKTKYPLLQIAVPDVYDGSTEDWNTDEYKPLVAFVPEDFDEKTTKSITAFDIDGNEYELDAKNPPENPVIVINENERLVTIPKSKAVDTRLACGVLLETVLFVYIDAIYYNEYQEYYDDFFAVDARLKSTVQPSSPCANQFIYDGSNNNNKKYTPDTRSPQRAYNSNPPSVTRDDVITKAKFVSMDALKQVESWANGAPEVEMVVTYTLKQNNTYSTQTIRKIFTDDGWTKGGFLGIGRSIDTKILNVPVLYWDKDNFGNLIKYTFIESDGNTWGTDEYTVSYANTYKEENNTTTVQASAKIKIGDCDDIIGEAVLNYNDPVIGEGKRYSTGLLEFWIALQGTY
ncbi:MAG: DUF3103 domain-containing protein [Prevotellaceae bacterium]|jgi:hypothetical protein|nr:DUF3103 domain-containing protein [Prevotellaceae bacterium]